MLGSLVTRALARAEFRGGHPPKASSALWTFEDPRSGSWRALCHLGAASLISRETGAQLVEIEPWTGAPFEHDDGAVYAYEGVVFGPMAKTMLPEGWIHAPRSIPIDALDYLLVLDGRSSILTVYKDRLPIALGRWSRVITSLSIAFRMDEIAAFNDSIRNAVAALNPAYRQAANERAAAQPAAHAS